MTTAPDPHDPCDLRVPSFDRVTYFDAEDDGPIETVRFVPAPDDDTDW